MKVLLFVDGPNGPKCVRWWAVARRLETTFKSLVLKAKGRGACRWWLVECENAEAGRRVINYARIGIEVPWHEGRILASGGTR